MNKNNIYNINSKLRKTKGITLIALVVTIVVILILAGIAISFTVGPNGIIEQAKNAKNKYLASADSEREALNVLANQLDSGDYGTISAADLATATTVPENITSKQVTDKSGNILYYIDDTALNNKDLSNVTTDTNKVTVSSGKAISDYIVYYKSATEDNISNGAVAYVDGKIIIGNGEDVSAAYQQGYNDAKQSFNYTNATYKKDAYNYGYNNPSQQQHDYTISTIAHTGKVVVNCSTTVVGASNDSKSFYYHNSVNGSNKTLSEGTTYVLDCNTGDYIYFWGQNSNLQGYIYIEVATTTLY